MITEILIENREGRTIKLRSMGNYTDSDIAASWYEAKQLGRDLVVSWYRSTDGQRGYWSDEGASLHPVYT